MVPYVVEDEVVPLALLREVLAGVVDDVVGADRADQVHVPRAAHAGHVRSERLRKLHREGTDAARRTVDQDLLPGSHLALVAKRLQGDEAGQGSGRGVLEREVGRLRLQRVGGNGRLLGEGAVAPAEDRVTWPEPRHARADGLNLPRYIRPSNAVLWLAQPPVHRARDVRE